MNIQWFPGHMLETKNQLKSSIAKVDALLEVVDARLPLSSSNPFVDQIAKGKNRMKILNKSDIADPQETQAWLEYFNQDMNLPAAAICGTHLQETSHALESLVSQVNRNQARKAKVMVVGIPNTGKSTILNTLAGRKVAKTGNVPAVTRHQQRTSLKGNIDIYDTPGILWPVIEPRQRGLALAVSGAISDTAIDYHEIAYFAAQLLLERYPDCLVGRYPFLNPLPGGAQALIETVGKARGCLKKGGYVDFQKASQLIIRDLRSGRLGRISFETPKDIDVTHDTDH
ncbi:ribosome biogenesis GTPase YlqF [Desulfobacter vibrioformis]|uniref:ribosome biogenesis GTPase YlqF n=1 Tax=Desulfobacter vibrioformis TaxID=34031 RepID=UPI0005547552|nr:ribosome biogenesis GTPase YlqF [Desulfobacter vibrioformis]